ncbi:MAG TPA: branched-chain amino acid ABC transporter substrate-binding protein [Actinomycetota bacterium]|nr:branched-chain amino acid ABC transporter substrate-binding protein [Actinomycetota bacterium]
MKRSKWFFLVALLSVFALVGAACGDDGGDTDVAGDDEPKDCEWVIGTMGALSGDYASVGQPIADGVEYAVDQANENADLQCELSVQTEDSQGDPTQATPLARSLVDNEKLVACICPYFSGETLGTGKIFSQAGVLISGTGTNATIDEQGFETWFRAVAPDNIQGEVAAQYIAAQGVKKVAIIHDNQDYSKGLADEVQKGLGDLAVGPFIITPGEPDYSAVVSEVVNASPDFIFYGGYTPEAGPLAKQLAEAGVTVPFMTDDGAKDPTFGELAGKKGSANAFASCPCVDPLKIEAATEFVEGMRAEYGENAPGTFAADMYDVTNIVIEALGTYEGDPEDTDEVRAHVVDYFDQADGIEGVAKSYSWNEDGEFEGGPGDIWIYKWDQAEGNFVSVGPAEELI